MVFGATGRTASHPPFGFGAQLVWYRDHFPRRQGFDPIREQSPQSSLGTRLWPTLLLAILSPIEGHHTGQPRGREEDATEVPERDSTVSDEAGR